MINQDLADRTRYYKETEEGVSAVCKVMEDMRNETRKEEHFNTVLENIKAIMQKLGNTAEAAMELLDVPVEAIIVQDASISFFAKDRLKLRGANMRMQTRRQKKIGIGSFLRVAIFCLLFCLCIQKDTVADTSIGTEPDTIELPYDSSIDNTKTIAINDKVNVDETDKIYKFSLKGKKFAILQESDDYYIVYMKNGKWCLPDSFSTDSDVSYSGNKYYILTKSTNYYIWLRGTYYGTKEIEISDRLDNCIASTKASKTISKDYFQVFKFNTKKNTSIVIEKKYKGQGAVTKEILLGTKKNKLYVHEQGNFCEGYYERLKKNTEYYVISYVKHHISDTKYDIKIHKGNTRNKQQKVKYNKTYKGTTFGVCDIYDLDIDKVKITIKGKGVVAEVGQDYAWSKTKKFSNKSKLFDYRNAFASIRVYKKGYKNKSCPISTKYTLKVECIEKGYGYMPY